MATITKQILEMPTYPDSIRSRTSDISMGRLPFAEFLNDLRPIEPTQPNASYGYNRVVNVTRLPHELLTLRQSLSLDGFFQAKIWKHAVLECCGRYLSISSPNMWHLTRFGSNVYACFLLWIGG